MASPAPEAASATAGPQPATEATGEATADPEASPGTVVGGDEVDPRPRSARLVPKLRGRV